MCKCVCKCVCKGVSSVPVRDLAKAAQSLRLDRLHDAVDGAAVRGPWGVRGRG